MLIRLLTTIFIFTSLIKTGQSADLIKDTREKIAQINITFLEDIMPDESSILELKRLLYELCDGKNLLSSNNDENDYKITAGQLIKSFKSFEEFYQGRPVFEILKVKFRAVNNGFNSLCGNYFLDELKRSSKQKIIFFSTSMSCECTLEMCYKQEAEIQKLQKRNPGLFDYAVVDTWVNSDIQRKYDVEFIPTVVIYDSKNKEAKRFVREENVNEIINYIFNIN